ncbi:Hypothetical predicted protein [Cloeon dipterum]|uniref:Tetratricopeptide repeat protein 1 n=1 Tax=Cloeon dipterum TaxID=197152 RepID=A0A8S1CPB6_9INSE|nr:Hypothetical predicted protein [Cloeon dipterum]
MDSFTEAESSRKAGMGEEETKKEEDSYESGEEGEGAAGVSEEEAPKEEEPSGQDDSEWSQQHREEVHLEVLQIKEEANKQFKEGLWEDAAAGYGRGLQLCPRSMAKDLAILHANRAAALLKVALVDEAIKDCDKAVKLDPKYVRALARRAGAYETKEKLDEALEDWKQVLEIDPDHREARAAVHRLPGEINERNEKLKSEMIDKLKGLGDMILRPFNLSTNNFKLTPNEAGGYSVQFEK